MFTRIASQINQISQNYHLGLQVIPQGINSTDFGNEFGPRMEMYAYALGWIADYPWVLDFLYPMYVYAPPPSYSNGQEIVYPIEDGWNLTQMTTLYHEAAQASAENNIPALISASDKMNSLANQEVMYLWEVQSSYFVCDDFEYSRILLQSIYWFWRFCTVVGHKDESHLRSSK